MSNSSRIAAILSAGNVAVQRNVLSATSSDIVGVVVLPNNQVDLEITQDRSQYVSDYPVIAHPNGAQSKLQFSTRRLRINKQNIDTTDVFVAAKRTAQNVYSSNGTTFLNAAIQARFAQLGYDDPSLLCYPVTGTPGSYSLIAGVRSPMFFGTTTDIKLTPSSNDLLTAKLYNGTYNSSVFTTAPMRIGDAAIATAPFSLIEWNSNESQLDLQIPSDTLQPIWISIGITSGRDLNHLLSDVYKAPYAIIITTSSPGNVDIYRHDKSTGVSTLLSNVATGSYLRLNIGEDTLVAATYADSTFTPVINAAPLGPAPVDLQFSVYVAGSLPTAVTMASNLTTVSQGV